MKRIYRCIIYLFFILIITNTNTFCDDVQPSILYPAKIWSVKGYSYGYINSDGKWVIKPTYEGAFPFSDNRAVVIKNNLYGVIDSSNKFIVQPQYDSINSYKDGLAICVYPQGMGLIDINGRTVTKRNYTFIQEFSEGLAEVSIYSPEGTLIYGYINKKGNEVIPPKYVDSSPFTNGVAIVKEKDRTYHLIDKTGKILNTFNHYYVSEYGNERLVFSNDDELLGYIDINNTISIKPQYTTASSFKNNVAIVSTSPYPNDGVGLINLSGDYIYSNIYNDIKMLNENRVALGKSLDDNNLFSGNKYAIGDLQGNILTDFIYLDVAEYHQGIASVSDSEYSYFVDTNGKKIDSFPALKGSGTLKKSNGLVIANIDYQLSYYDFEGNLIYDTNNSISLKENRVVQKIKYKPNKNYLVYYPKVTGLENKEIENIINVQLEQISNLKILNKEDVLDYDFYEDFSINFFNNDILVLNMNSSFYGFGAAHPLPERHTPVINLNNGKFYDLKDLFKEDVEWQNTLNSVLQTLSKDKKKYDYLFSDTEVKVKDNQPFYVDNKNLYIYYSPYEIAPYAAGFVTFKIPFTNIKDVINTQGDMWESINKVNP